MSLNRNKRDRLIAAVVTLGVAAVIVLALVFGYIAYDKALLQMPPEARLATLEEEEELFIEPELIEDLGEPDAVENDQPSPSIQGEPKPDIKENTQKIEPGKNEKPAPPVEKPITQTKLSPVKATEPSVTDKERKEVTSKFAGKFQGRNGSKDGSNTGTGAGGVGIGINGTASGRTFKGCPKPSVSLRNPVTVTVDVVIDAAGRVKSASARGGSNASIRRACEAAARQARWSEKEGAPDTKGSITFRITPR